MMPEYKMVVLSNPVAGREDEYNDWYQNTHLGDIVSLPGFKSARRFKLADGMVVPDPYRYMAVYEIETDDLDATLKGLIESAENGTIYVSDTLDSDNAYAVIYEACGEEVTGY